MNYKDKTTGINIALTGVFVFFAFWIMAVKNVSMMRWYDEMSLFETSGIYFRQFLHYPGGLLRYAGTFLTQLMYYPMLGSSVLILLWLLLAWIIRNTFGLRGRLYPMTLLVPICLLVSVVQLDEAWLSLKSTGYLFFPTLGFIFTAILYRLFRLFVPLRALLWIMTIGIPLLYPLLGFFALLGALLCIISCVSRSVVLFRRKESGQKPETTPPVPLIQAIIIAALTTAVPFLYYTYMPGNTVDNDYLHLKGLPELLMESHDIYLWRPFIAIVALLLIFGVLRVLGILKNLATRKLSMWIGMVLTLAGALWALQAERKSEQLRATVLMLRCVENNNWQGVLHIMSLTREQPNYSMLVLANLAKVGLGGQAEDLSNIRPVNTDRRHSEVFTITAFVEVPVDYYLGRFNQSYRWAMEHTVQYGKRVYFLKYMVKDALMRGEYKLAKKYNDILLSTLFHREWAESMNRYIDNPSLIRKNSEFEFVLRMSEEEKKRGD